MTKSREAEEHKCVRPPEQHVEDLRLKLLRAPPAMLIGGRWRPASSRSAFEVEDPSTGTLVTTAAAGGHEDIELAVRAARSAFHNGPWSRLSGARRMGLLMALAQALEEDELDLSFLEAIDTGHTLSSIRNGDVPLALRALRDNAGWAAKISGETPMHPAEQAAFSYYIREPIGVVGIITPWNAPLLMVLQKLSAALAAGCTVVIKPSELAPLSALRIGQACDKVGIPPGVVNIVTGTGEEAGRALTEHPDVNLISFTGSTVVGKSIMAAAASTNLKRVVLELGGKSPVLVFADADLDKAARSIVSEITFKSGQYCAAGSRVFAQASIQDALLTRMRAIMDGMRIGPGTDANTDMGPMICAKQRQRAAEIIGHSIQAGACVVRGGHARVGGGYFFEPTILTNASAQMRVSREEIFGPALVVTPVPDEASLDEVAALANDSIYGLSAKIWTRQIRIAHGLIHRLEAGQVVVNGGGGEEVLPFGGVKQSGYGRENGRNGVDAYTEIKSIRLGF